MGSFPPTCTRTHRIPAPQSQVRDSCEKPTGSVRDIINIFYKWFNNKYKQENMPKMGGSHARSVWEGNEHQWLLLCSEGAKRQ
jgi:hypothetical protein